MFRQNCEAETWTTDGAYTDVEATPSKCLTIIASIGKPLTASGELFHSVTADGSFICIADATSHDQGEEIVLTAMADPNVTSAMLNKLRFTPDGTTGGKAGCAASPERTSLTSKFPVNRRKCAFLTYLQE
jgi:hypothetical protein